MFYKAFLRHPASVGKSYAGHLWGAWRYGWQLQKAACSAFVHGLLPAVCETTASDAVENLYKKGQAKDAQKNT
ncbi:MAG: hypothetical protein GC134_01115 [Proteobacteria bacterium]|nr:hypothetical protein [Pseudomonadota bacterium]